MTGFDDFTMSLLTNEEVLKMHSNSRHSHQVWRKKINDIEHVLWTSVSSTGGQYIAAFNLGESNSEIEISLNSLLTSPCNIGKVFNLDSITLIESLHRAEKTGLVKIVRTAGLDYIKLNEGYSFIDCVVRYYEEIIQ